MHPLQHSYPVWEWPDDDPGGDLREVWCGNMRIVRNRRRARLLRKRGVPMLTVKPGEWLWFTE